MATKDKYKQAATEALKNNAAIDTVLVTSDVKVFTVISDAENYVKKKFEQPEEKKLRKYTRAELKVTAEIKAERKPSEVIEDIKSATTAEQVQELVAFEYRPLVLAQAKKKMKLLGADQDTLLKNELEEKLRLLEEENKQLKEDKSKS